MRSPIRRVRIATRLLLAFLVMALIPLGIVSFLSYRGSERGLRRDARSALRSVAANKAGRLESFARSRVEAAVAWANQPIVGDQMGSLEQALRSGGVGSPGYAKLAAGTRLLSRSLQDFGFTDVFLFTASGNGVFALNEPEGLGTNYVTGPSKDSERAKTFRSIRDGLPRRLFGFDDYAANPLFGSVGVPINRQGSLVGVAVMEVSKESVYGVVRDQTGLGITGDTVVGSLQGVAVVLNAPTRLGADKPLPSGGEEGPLQAAVRGQEGDFAGRDYRGHKVLSSFRNLPTLGWGLEVKIDESEVLAPLSGERRTLFRLAALGLPLVLGAALLAARSVSKPIVRLTREVRTISGGDLDRQVPVEGEDEVGELSVAFNAMTADLSRSYTMLQESRKRIVVAQDEARRTMERDIHDGAQQQLVSIAVKLGLVKMLLTKDMDKATGMLDQLKVETTDALNALRDLARGLFPPLLQEKGMVTALEAHIAKMEINATVDASSLAHIRFTPDIEAAVYFCLREAMQNASKYAPEAPITICFTLPDDGLHFVCKDEGPGFDTETAKRGSGTQNMLDRIEALGGTLELISAPGEGTSIVGRIPVTVLEPAESTDESPPDSSPGDGVLASGVRP